MAITYGTTFTNSWGSGTIDVAPPVGEIWEIQQVFHGSTGVTNAVIWGDVLALAVSSGWPSGASAAYVPFCLQGGVNRLRFTISSSPSSMSTYYKRFTAADLPLQSVVLGPIAAASGTVDLRPPVGKVWMVKHIAATIGPIALHMTDGTNTTSRALVPVPTWTTATPIVHCFLTNTIWGRVKNTSGATGYGVATYAELDATALPSQSIIVTGVNGTYTDVRPPAGQIWAIFGGTHNLVVMNAAGQCSNISGKFQIDNTTWIGLFNDGTYGGVSAARIA